MHVRCSDVGATTAGLPAPDRFTLILIVFYNLRVERRALDCEEEAGLFCSWFSVSPWVALGARSAHGPQLLYLSGWSVDGQTPSRGSGCWACWALAEALGAALISVPWARRALFLFASWSCPPADGPLEGCHQQLTVTSVPGSYQQS